jgi:hypothetical protein
MTVTVADPQAAAAMTASGTAPGLTMRQSPLVS